MFYIYIELTPDQQKANKESLIQRYKTTTIAYAERIDEPLFPKAYNALVHSSLFDTLLKIERGYAQVVADLIAERDFEISSLRTR